MRSSYYLLQLASYRSCLWMRSLVLYCLRECRQRSDSVKHQIWLWSYRNFFPDLIKKIEKKIVPAGIFFLEISFCQFLNGNFWSFERVSRFDGLKTLINRIKIKLIYLFIFCIKLINLLILLISLFFSA